MRGAKDMPAAGADTPLCYDATTGQLGSCPPVIVCVPDVTASPQFVDNGDGTVTDLHTCLMWEQKTGTVGSTIDCSAVTCSDPHAVNNKYKWTASVGGTAPDGGVYTDFLERVNGSDPFTGQCVVSTCTGLGGHSDWRIPKLAELLSIVPSPCPGVPPCIDSIFGATAPMFYWSATPNATFPTIAWVVAFFGNGDVINGTKSAIGFVRAVRGGS